jgi:hypothetical protein
VNLAWRWLAASALLLLALPACFGGPDDPIEYVHEGAIVLLQLQEVPDGVDTRRSVPRLTLYGDGTFIFVDADGALMQATLPDGDVEGLLESIVDAGFLDFDYDQPLPDSADPEPVTYLYVQTRDGANAVKARGLGSAEDVAGDEFAEYRKMRDVRDDLLAFVPPEAEPFAADTALIWASPAEVSSSAPLWPHEGIDLGLVDALAQEAADGSAVLLRGEEGSDIAGSSVLNALYRQDGQTYRVSFRPLLPNENAFPEFDSLGP